MFLSLFFAFVHIRRGAARIVLCRCDVVSACARFPLPFLALVFGSFKAGWLPPLAAEGDFGLPALHLHSVAPIRFPPFP